MAVTNLGDAVVSITGDNSQFNKSIDQSKIKLDSFASAAISFGTKMSLAVTTPLIGLGVAAVKSSAQMEMLEASFTTMLGSAEKASALMNELKIMAAKTPFETTDLATASKTLLQFGVNVKDVIPTLNMLGDASGGSSAKFSSMALVFGQIQSAGKLMGQDLLQLINAGFNPLKVISEQTGESMSSLKDKMSKGAISADQVTQAFKTATSQGGLFYKGMDTASKTLEGVLSTLKDDVATTGRSFVEDLLPKIKETVKGISSFAQTITNLDKRQKEAILTVAAVAAAIGPLSLAIGGAIKAVNSLSGAFTFLMANPAVAAIGVIALTLGTMTFNIIQAQKEFEKLNDIMKGGSTGDTAKDLELINDRIETINATIGSSEGLIPDENKELEEELVKLNQIKSDLADKEKWQAMNLRGQEAMNKAVTVESVSQEEINKALAIRDAVTKKYTGAREKVVGVLEDEKTEYQKIEDQINELEKTPWAKGKFEDDRLKAIEILRERQQEILEEERKTRQRNAKEKEKQDQKEKQDSEDRKKSILKDYRDMTKTTIESYQDRSKEIDKAKKEFIKAGVSEVDAEKWATKEKLALWEEYANSVVNQVSNIASQLSSIYNQDLNNQLDAIETKKNAAIDANNDAMEAALKAAGLAEDTDVEAAKKTLDIAKKEGDAEEILEAEKALKKVQIQEEYAAKEKAIEKEAALASYKIEVAQFKTNKALNIAQAVIAGAQATLQALKLGPIAGPIAAAIMAGLTAYQIKTIKEQEPPEAPSFAEGGIVLPTSGGTNAIVGEGGQPEVIFPLDKLEQFLVDYGTGNTSANINNEALNLTITLDSKILYSGIFNATKNRKILIDAGAIV